MCFWCVYMCAYKLACVTVHTWHRIYSNFRYQKVPCSIYILYMSLTTYINKELILFDVNDQYNCHNRAFWMIQYSMTFIFRLSNNTWSTKLKYIYIFLLLWEIDKSLWWPLVVFIRNIHLDIYVKSEETRLVLIHTLNLEKKL